ncbi:MAG: calcineurin-like phosphoesterase C-terminal domain-containing protein, partial [Alistipes sp.]|nr:calcineurin-like phosphoesterase C-terminal domain-containing protein [Alistipes sp.]
PRMNVNMTAKKNIFPKYHWDLKDHIVANFWNAEIGEWELTLWQNGEKVCEMTNFKEYDYYALYWFCEIYGSAHESYQYKTQHLYHGKLKYPDAPFEVRAVDKKGKRGPYTCSEITTNYDGLNGDFQTHIP